MQGPVYKVADFSPLKALISLLLLVPLLLPATTPVTPASTAPVPAAIAPVPLPTPEPPQIITVLFPPATSKYSLQY